MQGRLLTVHRDQLQIEGSPSGRAGGQSANALAGLQAHRQEKRQSRSRATLPGAPGTPSRICQSICQALCQLIQSATQAGSFSEE